MPLAPISTGSVISVKAKAIPNPMTPITARPVRCIHSPATISHGASDEPMLRGGHDDRSCGEPPVALPILEGMAHLVGDHRGGGHRQLRRAATRQRGNGGHRLAHPQHLGPRVVVVGQLAGRGLDPDAGQALAVQQSTGKVVAD